MVAKWVTSTLVPSIALILTNLMWFSPLKSVLESRKSRDLGATNPIPYVVTVLNTIGWMTYGLFIDDPFLFWSNVSGVGLGLFYSINALTILSNKVKPNEEFPLLYLVIERGLVFTFVFWSVIFLVCVSAFNNFADPRAQGALLVGRVSMAFVIAYYASPLYSMLEVIRTKDSSSLYAPLLCVNLVNSSLWLIYGLSLGDFSLYFPNLFGVPLTVLQLIMLVIYSKHKDLKSAFLGSGGKEKGESVAVSSEDTVDFDSHVEIGNPLNKI